VKIDQKTNTSYVKGFFKLAWMDKRLTWNPQDWAGIELVYMNSQEIWKPDIHVVNQVNWENHNIGASDNQLVRVWADRANLNDITTTHKVNVEWVPVITFDVFHKFYMDRFPLDEQIIQI